MKKLIIAFFLAISIFSSAQEKNIKNFKKDFEKIINSDLTEDQLNKLFQDYPLILTPHTDTTQLFASLQGNNLGEYSMQHFKDDNLYKQNINLLIDSENKNKRILSYLLIASTQDTSKEQVLLEKIKSEKDKGNLLWSGMALLSLRSNHTDELFDFLIRNEDFGDAHMIPLYFQLNKDSLRNTAYKRINDDNEKSKVLAVQLLSITENNPKTEGLVKYAVANWNVDIKGYAVYTLKQLQIPNQLSLLKPLLNDKKTRKISLESLADSPTEEDREYIVAEAGNNKAFDEDVMDALFQSKNINNLKLWLSAMQKKEPSKDYFFSISNQSLITSDDMLEDLHKALQNIKNKNVLGELVRALKQRNDNESAAIMLNLLKNPSSTVRYWTAVTVENNSNPIFQTKENKKLIKRGIEDGNSPD